MDYGFLLLLAIILLSTKFLGGLSERVNMPQVVGALIAGVILGPSVLNIAHETDFLEKTAEIGVILLMFMAGLDTDLKEIRKNSVSFMVIASIGVIAPLILGAGCYFFYFHVNPGDTDAMLRALFIGVILTATSVSITVEALREMGKLDSKVGSAVLGAAVIDDILGIITLTIVFSLKDPDINIVSILLKIGIYALLVCTGFLLIQSKKPFLDKIRDKRRFSIYIMAILLIVAFVTEEFFGIADITGAYLFGLSLSNLKSKSHIAKKFTVPGYLFFSPVFFASIGIKTELNGLTKSLLVFSLILLLAAVLSKVIGCGLGAKMCGYSNKDSLNIGIGMISRGEVALIIAQKGNAMGLLDKSLFSPVILVVIVTTIVAPVLLKHSMKERNRKKELPSQAA